MEKNSSILSTSRRTRIKFFVFFRYTRYKIFLGHPVQKFFFHVLPLLELTKCKSVKNGRWAQWSLQSENHFFDDKKIWGQKFKKAATLGHPALKDGHFKLFWVKFGQKLKEELTNNKHQNLDYYRISRCTRFWYNQWLQNTGRELGWSQVRWLPSS